MCQFTTTVCEEGNRITAAQMARHERLVQWVVRRQWLGSLPFQDALHEGHIGLWSALRCYDPQRGTAFSTYAVPAIAHAVWRAVALDQRPSVNRFSAPSVTDGDEIDAMDRPQTQAALHNLVAQLPIRLSIVIVAHYGLDGSPPRTSAAIGRVLGVTRQRAHQLHGEAILWLAQPAHSLWLRRLLGRHSRHDYRRQLARARQAARGRYRRCQAGGGQR